MFRKILYIVLGLIVLVAGLMPLSLLSVDEQIVPTFTSIAVLNIVEPTVVPASITLEGTPKVRAVDTESIAQTYGIDDVDYLDFILEVEKTFELEPYELMALIACESGFVSQNVQDAGSLSYSTTQMKLPTAKTAYMAMTEYYHFEGLKEPSHSLLADDKYYATLLAGGYLKYLHDTYGDKYESYTAYNRGIQGRLDYYSKYGNFKSQYATRVVELTRSFKP